MVWTIFVEISNHEGGPVILLTSVATVSALATVATLLLLHMLHMLTVPVLDLWHKLAKVVAPTKSSAVVLAFEDAVIRMARSLILGPAGPLSVLGPAGSLILGPAGSLILGPAGLMTVAAIAGLLTVTAIACLLTVVASRVSAIRRGTWWTSSVIVRRGISTERLEPFGKAVRVSEVATECGPGGLISAVGSSTNGLLILGPLSLSLIGSSVCSLALWGGGGLVTIAEIEITHIPGGS